MSPPRPCFDAKGDPIIPGRTLLSCRIGPGPWAEYDLLVQIGRVATASLIAAQAWGGLGDFIDDTGQILPDAMLQLNGHSLARRPEGSGL
jgi:hypothetical protein